MGDKIFGWLPWDNRTSGQNKAAFTAMAKMPRFQIDGRIRYPKNGKAFLWEAWKDPRVTKTTDGKVYLGFHQFTGSCFRKGSPVRMSNGYEKNIEDIQIGEEVITHLGNKKKVVRTFKLDYTGEMHTFHVKGWRFPVTVTDDHDCIIARSKGGYRYEFKEFKKKKANEVEIGDRFQLPSLHTVNENHILDLGTLCDDIEVTGINTVYCNNNKGNEWENKRFIELDEKLAWIIGLYIAEGSLKFNNIIFSLNPDKKLIIAEQLEEYIKVVFGIDVETVRKFPKETVLQVSMLNGIIARLIRALVPDIVYDKRVPGVIINSPKLIRLACLRGWMDGDGHLESTTRLEARGVTASPGLARDMGQLALACGMRPSVIQRKKEKHQRVPSWDVYLTGQDVFNIFPDKEAIAVKKGQPKLMEKNPYGYSSKVEAIDKEFVQNEIVYCIEVEDDHSLIVNGTCYHQCVGNGGGNTVFSLSAIEVVRMNDPYQALIPFYLANYGMSRHYSGDDGEGEGSTGSAFAQSVREDGIVPANLEGLPKYTWADGIEYGARAEMQWSSYRNIPKDLLKEMKKHLVKTTSPVTTADQIRDSIVSGYPVSWCGDWGGLMECPTVGNPPVLMNHHADTWNHQQSCHGWWDHPTEGEIFYVLNNWGLKPHGQDPAGGPPGGYWIKKEDCDYEARNGECYSFSQFDGFPAPDWEIPWIFS